MRKILLALVLIAGLSVSGFAQINRTINLTTGSKIGPMVGAVVTPIDERGAGITQHIIIWNVVGTVSACSVKVEQSATGTGGWSDLIAGATCTSNSSSALTTGTANYIRINATTLTGTGTLSVRYIAFPPGQALTATVDTTGLATSANQTTGNASLATIATNTTTLVGLAATDPCAGALTTGVDLHLASTTVTRVISASSSNKNYICSMDIVVGGTAEIVSLVEGTGANCTSPAVLWGSATAANGFAFGANGGIARSKTISGKTANIATCVQTSGSNAITVHIEYVQAP